MMSQWDDLFTSVVMKIRGCHPLANYRPVINCAWIGWSGLYCQGRVDTPPCPQARKGKTSFFYEEFVHL